MPFDFAGLSKVDPMQTLRPRRMLGTVASDPGDVIGYGSSDNLGQATSGIDWKQNEVYQNSPRALQAQAQYEQEALQERQQTLREQMARDAQFEKDRQAYEDWKKQQLYNKAFSFDSTKQQQALQTDANGAIAEQLHSTGIEALKNGDASTGLEMIQNAAKIRKQATEEKISQGQLDAINKEQVGQLFGTVQDQQTLDAIKPELAKRGVILPQEMQTYTPISAKWYDAQAAMSSKVAQSMRIDLQTQRMAAQQEHQAAMDQLNKEKEARIAANQEAARDRAENNYLTGKPLSKNDIALGIKELSDQNSDFGDLNQGDQIAAVKDIDSVARMYMTQHKTSSFDEARNFAKRMVTSNIKDGKYSPIQIGQQIQQQAPMQSQEIAKPSTQEEFNALPKGARFINPKDGKTYIKN